MRDYWDSQLFDDVNNSDFIGTMVNSYMSPQSCTEPLTSHEKNLVQLFELRLTANFSLDDFFHPSGTQPNKTYHIHSLALRNLPLLFRLFQKTSKSFYGSLDPAARSSVDHLAPIHKKTVEIFGLVEKLSPEPSITHLLERPQDHDDLRTYRNSVSHPDYEYQDLRWWYSDALLGSGHLDSFLGCASLICVYVDGLMRVMPDAFIRAFGKLY